MRHLSARSAHGMDVLPDDPGEKDSATVNSAEI